MSRLPGERLTDVSIFRISHRDYEPWLFRDWTSACADGTFGYRWDDPGGEYRVIYSARERTGAFMETLQRFVAPADMVALAGMIAFTSADGPPSIEPNVVPKEWASERVVGSAKVSGDFAAAHVAKALQCFREALASVIVRLELIAFDYDLSALLLRTPRDLSQHGSRMVYDDAQGFGGIICPSRMGYEFLNVTMFEHPDGKRDPVAPTRVSIDDKRDEGIAEDDPSLLEALDNLSLRLE